MAPATEVPHCLRVGTLAAIWLVLFETPTIRESLLGMSTTGLGTYRKLRTAEVMSLDCTSTRWGTSRPSSVGIRSLIESTTPTTRITTGLGHRRRSPVQFSTDRKERRHLRLRY